MPRVLLLPPQNGSGESLYCLGFPHAFYAAYFCLSYIYLKVIYQKCLHEDHCVTGTKRKQMSLSVTDRVELLVCLDEGASVESLCGK